MVRSERVEPGGLGRAAQSTAVLRQMPLAVTGAAATALPLSLAGVRAARPR